MKATWTGQCIPLMPVLMPLLHTISIMCLSLHVPFQQVLKLELENLSHQECKTKITGFPTDTSDIET